ncbi:dolichol-phosphate mannosyltransferase subunit 3-like [Lingula anatina]|uniref:Dolichol-phosphate mannosyltransferase subunit 3 n=1 Tax=Lingula anatina TaxID=7574 RepID=A0A1S3I528_LINAN|nr:dolichol-phosphate mannosyltransferase subunit 3-like [Lingula anatina]XP_013420063.1 dolichol-phosphate mannosyltransferase subunit 3-like [Lingula anatina]XP_013420064.1 dolichol-phosphate mannosyltransferase subunit 3-like [Lingula anatina]|eukprot:XP_013420062.1 dolichol-phosphate mannosyltransferase subunit 3-like [Lingula anatina]
MTKLMQWLFVLSLLAGVWTAVVTESVPVNMSQAWKNVVWMAPIYAVICFGCWALATVGYRVVTFNDCEEAAEELKQQIEEAKKDLTSKGFKFS